jgi:hypothetical protein
METLRVLWPEKTGQAHFSPATVLILIHYRHKKKQYRIKYCVLVSCIAIAIAIRFLLSNVKNLAAVLAGG